MFLRLVTWFRCVCSAPFGKPVVPEVYMIDEKSVDATCTSGRPVVIEAFVTSSNRGTSVRFS